MMYLLLIVGFVLLVKGADFFVSGASSVAKALKVPSVIIGLTIVAMGTSAPETAVSITASLGGNNGISLGNIIGSNIFNLLMVIGISAVIIPFNSDKEILKRDMLWNIAITVLLLVLIFDGSLSRLDGVILLAGIAAYLTVVVRSALKNRVEDNSDEKVSVPKAVVFILGGLAAIVFGGDLVVDNASLIAKSLGMSDTLVGLTIVAIGTSLPELVTSIVAAKKGDSGLALGNAVGSCIFNILFILGIASTIAPMTADYEIIADVCILIFVSIVTYIFARSKERVSRLEGLLCVLIYGTYSAYIIMR
ncbi:calcium/sodium antiporter [Anaerotignum sp. MSJ-24]|nr:calcium/sodium antiporter [Anaerotignum sp. MSJ-24]MBU5463330.1 calcium/sodium antiporter [Anaerotignum sp. MSJ-24]